MLDRRLLARGLVLRCRDALLRLRQKVADRLVNDPIEWGLPTAYVIAIWILGIVVLVLGARGRSRG